MWFLCYFLNTLSWRIPNVYKSRQNCIMNSYVPSCSPPTISPQSCLPSRYLNYYHFLFFKVNLRYIIWSINIQYGSWKNRHFYNITTILLSIRRINDNSYFHQISNCPPVVTFYLNWIQVRHTLSILHCCPSPSFCSHNIHWGNACL